MTQTPIKDHPNLVKNSSGVVINKDTSGLAAAKARKQKQKQEKQEIDELKNKVDRIESMLSTLIDRFTEDGK